jgi:hypothetical protein
MQQKKYRRLEALTAEVQKIESRIALYKTAADTDAPDVQLMLRQYTHLRRERYADYLQELISLDTHPKNLSNYIVQLVKLIYVDNEDTDTALLAQSLPPLLRAEA